MDLLFSLNYWAAILGIGGGIYTLFAATEAGMKKELKEKISSFVFGKVSLRFRLLILSAIPDLFDSFFGYRRASFRFISRSVMVSLISTVLFFYIDRRSE